MKRLLENTIDAYFNERFLSPSIVVNDKVIFKFFNDININREWSVDISSSLIIESLNNNNFIDVDIFMNGVIKQLIENYGIIIKKNQKGKVKWTKKLHMESEKNFQTLYKYTDYQDYDFERLINLERTQDIIIIDGEEKSGKTYFIKQFCLKYSGLQGSEKSANYYYIDFNGGMIDFTDMLMDFFSLKDYEDIIYIVLDNLECCGVNDAFKIYSFFSNLIKVVREKNLHPVKLVIVQDKDSRIIENINDLNAVLFTKKETTKLLTSTTAISKNDNQVIGLGNDNYITKLIPFSNLNEEEKRLIFKIILISSYGAKVNLKKEEIKTCLDLLNKIDGLKLYSNDKISFYDSKICCMLLEYISENYIELRYAEIYKKDYSNVVNEIVSDYRQRQKISLSDVACILQNNAYIYDGNDDKSAKMRDFIELIEMAKQSVNKIINSVEDSYNLNEPFFGNHFGAILFAAEALSFYANDDWNALKAWKYLADYVREIYYIDGQKLPEIKLGKEKFEKTYIDFYNGEHENSIKSQIALHDEVLDRFSNVITENDFSNYDILDDSIFAYILSPIQQKQKNVEDINKFFNTYILALLFEFEVTAPKSEYNEVRIEKLFNKIELNIIDENDCAYFYPARVPWVTARMLLALCESRKINLSNRIRRLINEVYIPKMNKWLEECSVRFNYDNETYRIWVPGTGTWNGVLETTMMCTFALIQSGGSQNAIKEGVKYIQKLQTKWLKSDSIADGIWANETLWHYNTVSNTRLLEESSKLKKELDKFFIKNDNLNTDSLKNDRSLGDSHISKTLISLVSGLLGLKELIFVENSTIMNITNKTKIFISFKTDTGYDIAKLIYDSLNTKKDYKPYIYTEDMRAGNWPNQLKNAIVQSDFCFLVVSKDVFTSKNVLNEIKIMIDYDCNIIPILIGDDIDAIEELNKKGSSEIGNEYYFKIKNILNFAQTNIIRFDIKDVEKSLSKLLQYCNRKN